MEQLFFQFASDYKTPYKKIIPLVMRSTLRISSKPHAKIRYVFISFRSSIHLNRKDEGYTFTQHISVKFRTSRQLQAI